MVNTGNPVAYILQRNVQVMRQFKHSVWNRMAQPDCTDIGEAFTDRPAIDRHRIHILQHECMRAQLGHVCAQIPQERHGSQPAHNTTNPQCIGNGLAQPILFRDIEISHRAWLVTTNLDRDNNKICPVKCSTA